MKWNELINLKSEALQLGVTLENVIVGDGSVLRINSTEGSAHAGKACGVLRMQDKEGETITTYALLGELVGSYKSRPTPKQPLFLNEKGEEIKISRELLTQDVDFEKVNINPAIRWDIKKGVWTCKAGTKQEEVPKEEEVQKEEELAF